MKKILFTILLIITNINSSTEIKTTILKTNNTNTRLNITNLDQSLLSYAIFLETNRERAKYSIPPLSYMPKLSNVALYHSKEMVKNNYLGHNDKNGNGFSKRMRMHNLPKTRLSENCALSFGIEYDSKCKIRFNGSGNFKKNGKQIPYRTYRSAAKNIVSNLMNSAGHRKNILDKKVNKVGVGVVFYNKSSFNNILTIKTTQIFSK